MQPPIGHVGWTLKEVEREAIGRALTREHGNMTATAKRLGIDRRTLYRKVRSHGLGDGLAQLRRGQAQARRGGYTIVCPDSKARHYPYGNEEDAMHDAHTYSSEPLAGCVADVDMIEEHGKCPGGAHTVMPCIFMPPAAPG